MVLRQLSVMGHGGYDPVPPMRYVDKDAEGANGDYSAKTHRKEKNWKTFYKL